MECVVKVMLCSLIPPAVKSVRDRPSYFAEKLYNLIKSMKGARTDDDTLTQVMVTRQGFF